MKKEFFTIEEALHGTGVFRHYCGHDYFIQAVLLAKENPKRLQNIRQEIYIPISKMFHTSYFNVEKDIRTVRDVMMKNGGAELLTLMTHTKFWICRAPYPKEIIGIFAEYFKEN